MTAEQPEITRHNVRMTDSQFRLYKAAPKLLEACKTALDYIPDVDLEDAEILESIQAAIALAEKGDWCGEFTYVQPFSMRYFSSTAKRFFRQREKTGNPIRTTDEFLSLTKEDVLSVRTIGKTTWREIERKQRELEI